MTPKHQGKITGLQLLRSLVTSALLSMAGMNVAQAGSMAVWPVQLHLAGDAKPSQLEVTNPSDGATYIQILPLQWLPDQDVASGPMADDLIAVPPVFELQPGEKQVVRVALRQTIDDGAERAYRLLITEVPRTAGLVPNTLAIAARLNLPVFATPSEASPQAVWTIQHEPMKAPELVVLNQGNGHVNIKSVALLEEGAADPAFASEGGGHVISGDEKRWALDIDLRAIKGPVKVRAETDQGPIEASVTLPES